MAPGNRGQVDESEDHCVPPRADAAVYELLDKMSMPLRKFCTVALFKLVNLASKRPCVTL